MFGQVDPKSTLIVLSDSQGVIALTKNLVLTMLQSISVQYNFFRDYITKDKLNLEISMTNNFMIAKGLSTNQFLSSGMNGCAEADFGSTTKIIVLCTITLHMMISLLYYPLVISINVIYSYLFVPLLQILWNTLFVPLLHILWNTRLKECRIRAMFTLSIIDEAY
jgi:hypothetical protein